MTLGLILAAAIAQGAPICQDAGTTGEIARCAATLYSRSDARMNLQWRATLERMKKRDRADAQRPLPGPGYAAALLDSQRKWLAFRDSQCRIEGYRMRGGTGQGYTTSICLSRLTDERARVLRDLNL